MELMGVMVEVVVTVAVEMMLMTRLLKWPLRANYCDTFSPHSSLYSHFEHLSWIAIFYLVFLELSLFRLSSLCSSPFCCTPLPCCFTAFLASFFSFHPRPLWFCSPSQTNSSFELCLSFDQRLSMAENRNPCGQHAAFAAPGSNPGHICGINVTPDRVWSVQSICHLLGVHVWTEVCIKWG